MKTALWWIRRDLRLDDNQALEAALGEAERVVPVFVLDPALLGSSYVGDKRKAFLFGALRDLSSSLARRGSRLVVRSGSPEEALSRLRAETEAEAIFLEQDVSPYARHRDQRLGENLPLRGVWGVSVLTPREGLKNDGDPYTTFTPYSRAWKREAASKSIDLVRPPEKLPAVPDLRSDPVPDTPALPAEVPFVATDRAANASLETFLDGPIYRYGEDRNRLDLNGASGLSPYLRFGLLSSRRAVSSAWRAIDSAPGQRERSSAEAWLGELVWREFYLSILYHFPRVRKESFRLIGDKGIAWRDDPEQFGAWCEGRTGYPVVDAAMRELVQTGFMHNRARMIVASFLTKHLLLDWRLGERFFMQHLVDGDPAANNGGWQWSAGTGTDAAPYFRIFNPILQGKRHDPEGRYVRRWLPELEGVADGQLHEPKDPIVTHTKGRVRALEAFEKAKSSA